MSYYDLHGVMISEFGCGFVECKSIRQILY
jgi:hypothetical protein